MSVERNDAEKYAWEAMRQQALSSKTDDLDQNFSMCGASDDSLDDMTAGILISHGLASTGDIRSVAREPIVGCAVREVFQSAQHLGLIVTGRLG